jgi:hypothetical protein
MGRYALSSRQTAVRLRPDRRLSGCYGALRSGRTTIGRNALREQDNAKSLVICHFVDALLRRHKIVMTVEHFDPLGLTLAAVAEKATCANDLAAVAEVVERLRSAGVPWKAAFEALALRGQIADAPPGTNLLRILIALVLEKLVALHLN